MEPFKQWGSTCSGGSPLVLGQVDLGSPPVLGNGGPGVYIPVLGSVDRGLTKINDGLVDFFKVSIP